MEYSKKDRIYKVTMLVIITGIITFMITSIGMYNYFTKTDKGNMEILESIDTNQGTVSIEEKLKIVKSFLDKYYIGETDIEDMEEGAIKGYVAALEDKYTQYMSKREYEDLLTSVTGNYVGIGIYMYEDENNNIIVLEPIEGSPAKEAGLQTDDIIISINGESCSGMGIDDAAEKIKGEAGTTVTLEILRGNETITKTIERRAVQIQDSSSEVLDGNIGYISLTTFDEKCSTNVLGYLQDFKNKGIKSVIIDLRDNTGGIVTEAIELSEIFVKKGDVIMRSYSKAGEEQVVTSSSNNVIDMKVVVLVNEYSASATEIFVAALKDNKLATIVGTKTYGKGVMQEVIPLLGGALKVTIEEFKTPNGDKINEEGITPDITVEDDWITEEDEQLMKAQELLR